MKRISMKYIFSVVVIVLGAAFAPASELEYYKGSQYPGKMLRSDVETPTVTTHKAPKGEIARRAVEFWPRKGVDFIPLDKRMPLRTWTFEAGPGEGSIWGRKPGVPEAGKDPSYREEYWDALSSFEHNVRAGLVLTSVRGYIIPPTSGRYTFYYAADDSGSFYLSSDEKAENLEPLAYNKKYSRKMNYFFRGPEQTSRVVPLEAGKKYYFEASYVDVGGGSWMSVAWRYEGRTYPEIIAGRYLESLDGKKGYAKAAYHEAALPAPINQYIAKKTLSAHMIGFRGVGNASIKSPKGKTVGRSLPSVVLRLPDGRKRTFGSESFSPEDQDYLEKEFIKARQQVYKASDKTPHKARQELKKDQAGKPGMLCEQTDHMSWYAGSQSHPGANSPWVNEVDLEEGRIYREETKAWGENMWLIQEYSGYPIYTWRGPIGTQTKYQVKVAGTMKDGYDRFNGFAGGGRGGCVASAASSGILSHEWGHGSGAGYGMEGDSDTFSAFCFPGPKGNPHVKGAPYRNFYGANENMYGLCSFGTLWGDDPNWGYGFYIAAPRGAEEPDVAYTYSRLMEQRGFVKEGEGIRGFGDLVGEYGARLTTFDVELETAFQDAYHLPTLSLLERIDAGKPLYRIHSDHEPEAFGMNMVRLDSEPGANEITVDFQGMMDPSIHSDWRACLIAVGQDGVRRYSSLWNKGNMSLAIRPDDASHFLTVAATPTALTSKKDGGILPTGRYAPVYPWQAEITGATPGTSAKRLGDSGNVVVNYAGRLLAPRRSATAQIQKVKDRYAAVKKIVTTEAKTEKEGQDRLYAALNLTTYQTAIDMLGSGKPHPNGGGWVADTAEVDETAYVGPGAMVVGASQVRENAVIEDSAIVLGRSVISGNAKVSGGAVLGNKIMDGYARCWDEVQDDDGHVRPLPLRAGRKQARPDGLWINYAMNGDGGLRLDDYFRHDMGVSDFYHEALGISLHGVVYGQPDYVKIDGKWGMRIAKSSQVAMLNPRAVDLGEITLALSLRREKAVTATLFDLGSNKDNCMVLTLNKKGNPKFVARKNGKTVVTLSGKTAIPLDQWAKLRVEIDGQQARLFVNEKPEATVKTTFRPCDVALPGAPQLSSLGNNRQKNSPLMGVLDELVIYSRVNEDFASLSAPVVNCPIRPSEGALEAVREYAQFIEEYNEKLKATKAPEDDSKADVGEFAEQMAYYKALQPRMQARLDELTMQDTTVAAAQAQLDVKVADYKERKKTLGEDAKQAPEYKRLVAENASMKKELRLLGDAWNKARNEAFSNDPTLQKLQGEWKTANDEWKKIPKGEQRRWKKGETEARRLHKKFSDYRAKLERKVIARTPVATEHEMLRNKTDRLNKELRSTADSYAENQMRPLKKEIGDLKIAIANAKRKAEAPQAPEYRALQGGLRGYFSKHYNRDIPRYTSSLSGKTATSVAALARTDDPGVIEDILEIWSSGKMWRTKVDWDWRINEEVDGKIETLPLLQTWLNRVRGPVLTKTPEGTNPTQ
tara:strand:+ start:2809 stop:7308 length:4500 start_codon:yes stop_codon:yes gene_type:complete